MPIEKLPPVAVKDNEPIRMAVIGTGGMGTGHCHAIMNLTEQGKTNTHRRGLRCGNEVMACRKACQDKQGIAVDAYVDYHDVLRAMTSTRCSSPRPSWHARLHAIAAPTRAGTCTARSR